MTTWLGCDRGMNRYARYACRQSVRAKAIRSVVRLEMLYGRSDLMLRRLNPFALRKARTTGKHFINSGLASTNKPSGQSGILASTFGGRIFHSISSTVRSVLTLVAAAKRATSRQTYSPDG